MAKSQPPLAIRLSQKEPTSEDLIDSLGVNISVVAGSQTGCVLKVISKILKSILQQTENSTVFVCQRLAVSVSSLYLKTADDSGDQTRQTKTSTKSLKRTVEKSQVIIFVDWSP